MAKISVQERIQKLQDIAVAREAGHRGILAASAVMLFVTCPMSIVAVAAPYWSGSQDIHGVTMSSTASLWTISATVEGGQSNAEQSVDMCGDTMQNSAIDCSTIHAARRFQITGLLIALASASILLVAFSPALKTRRELRLRLYWAGAGLAGATFLWDIVSIILVASVEMPEPYSLRGAGFVFTILSLPLAVAALVFIAWAIKSELANATSVVVVHVAPKSQNAQSLPTLLVVPSSEKQAVRNGKEAEDLEKQLTIVSWDVMETEKGSIAAGNEAKQATDIGASEGAEKEASNACGAGEEAKKLRHQKHCAAASAFPATEEHAKEVEACCALPPRKGKEGEAEPEPEPEEGEAKQSTSALGGASLFEATRGEAGGVVTLAPEAQLATIAALPFAHGATLD